MPDENQEQMGCATTYVLMLLAICVAIPIGALFMDLFTFGFGLREWIGSKRPKPITADDIFGMLFLAGIGFGGSMVILLRRGWSLRSYLQAFTIGVGIVFFITILFLPAWAFVTDPIVGLLADRWLSRDNADMLQGGLGAMAVAFGLISVIKLIEARGWLQK
jgi:hypothetical protein